SRPHEPRAARGARAVRLGLDGAGRDPGRGRRLDRDAARAGQSAVQVDRLDAGGPVAQRVPVRLRRLDVRLDRRAEVVGEHDPAVPERTLRSSVGARAPGPAGLGHRGAEDMDELTIARGHARHRAYVVPRSSVIGHRSLVSTTPARAGRSASSRRATVPAITTACTPAGVSSGFSYVARSPTVAGSNTTTSATAPTARTPRSRRPKRAAGSAVILRTAVGRS